jgi:arylsulfatase A-like enzyme
MTANRRAVSRKTVLVGIIVLAVAAVSSVVLWHRFGSLPSYFRGESDRVSPVLKPSGLEARNFFLAGGSYLLRLDSESPSLVWKIDRPVAGELEVAFHAVLKAGAATAFGFSATVTEGNSGARELFSKEWHPSPEEAVNQKFKVPISVAKAAAIEFRLAPPTTDDPSVLDAGITIPRLATRASGPKPSNLFIISIDALRRDALGVYQALSGRPPALSLSPELDKFSEDAVVFLNARTTQPSTWPALSSLHLSAYPAAHGVTENRTFLEAPGTSIATLMRDRGYATLALGSNGINLNIPGFEEKHIIFRGDDRLLAYGRNRVAAHAAAPFFHWYHLFGCHDQYFPPEWVMKIVSRDDPGYVHKRVSTNDMMRGEAPCGPKEVATVRRLYGGALFYTDSLLKETFDDLKRRGLWDDTLVIVTADHGEELYDHHGFFHHSPSLYDGALRVPLLIKFPRQRGRRVVAENVSHIDLLPTIHHYFAGRPKPGRYAGMSLLDLLAGKRRAFRERVLFAEAENSKVVAAVLGSHKLIHNPAGIIPRTPLGHPFPMGPVEFYDLIKDPGETTNLASIDHPVLRRLLAETSRYIREAQVPRREREETGKIELSDQERREAEEILRTLGYIK